MGRAEDGGHVWHGEMHGRSSEMTEGRGRGNMDGKMVV